MHHLKVLRGARRGLLPMVVAASVAASTLVTPLGAGAVPSQTGLSTATCTVTSATTRACDLWAKTGTLTLPNGALVNVLGYSDTVSGAAQVPGPTLVANQGDTVTVTLHNTLAESTGLVFVGQSGPTDTVGAPAGGSSTYSFAASTAGTSVYEASLTNNGPRQVAMGLGGAVVVRPSGTPAFDDEALVVLSELDPALNNSSDPSTFQLRMLNPSYGLINGKAQSAADTDLLSTGAGRRVQLRYVNASVRERSIGVLGLHQTVVAADGRPLTHPYQMVTETIPAGGSMDTLVTIPATATVGSRYAVYNGNFQLHNAGARSSDGTVTLGGMLTFLRVDTGAAVTDTAGPVTSSVSAAPNPADGTQPVTVTANVTDVSTGNSGVGAAEFFIDSLGSNGTGISMSAAFGTASPVAVSGTISLAKLSTLTGGNHTLLVHGKDGVGNWGSVASATLALATGGPTTTGVALTPDLTNGSTAIAVHASASDATTGSQNVVGGEFFLDTVGSEGSGTPLSPSTSGPVVSLDGQITAVRAAALSEGQHTVLVRAQDSLYMWGPTASAPLRIDRHGPVVTGAVGVAPSPNNGKQSYDTTPPPADGGTPPIPGVRITATLADAVYAGVNSNIAAVEAFVDAAGAMGSGIQLTPNDGFLNSPTEAVHGTLPLSSLGALSQGAHAILIHAQDAAGNWGGFTSGTLIIDRTPPVVSNVAVTNYGTQWKLTAVAADSTSNITAAEWFEGADPGLGLGTAMNASDTLFDSTTENLVSLPFTLSNGSHTLLVRARDQAGNWSTPIASPLVDPIFLDSFETGTLTPLTGWSGLSGTSALAVNTSAVMGGTGTYGLQVTQVSGSTSSKYVIDTTPSAETNYHARFYFNPRGTLSPNGHDIFQGLTGSGAPIFRVQYRRTVAGSTITYQVRACLLACPPANVGWRTITNAAHAIEIGWQSGVNGALNFYVDGSLASTLGPTDTTAYTLETVRLGPQAVTPGTSGTEWYDAFVSTRTFLIGP